MSFLSQAEVPRNGVRTTQIPGRSSLLSDGQQKINADQSDRISIFLIEEMYLLRAALAALLQGHGELELVGQSGTGPEMLEVIRSKQVGVILLSIASLTEAQSLRLIKRLKESNPQSKILVLGLTSDSSFVRQMILTGTTGYLHFRSASLNFFEAVKRVSHGSMSLDEQTTSHLLNSFLAQTISEPPRTDLTAREIEVLKMAAWGYTGSQIAEKLGISPHTADTHRMRATARLGFKHRHEIVRYAVLQGWLNDDPLNERIQSGGSA